MTLKTSSPPGGKPPSATATPDQDLTLTETEALPWDHPLRAKHRSDATETRNHEPSLTIQSMAEQADINWIVKNFMPQQTPTNVRVPMAGDFTHITDLRGALEAIRSAEDSFMQMPAQLRQQLDNDPQKFIEYCEDPKNIEQLRKLGLAIPEVKPDITRAELADAIKASQVSELTQAIRGQPQTKAAVKE